jgi:hypothetical protein
MKYVACLMGAKTKLLMGIGWAKDKDLELFFSSIANDDESRETELPNRNLSTSDRVPRIGPRRELSDVSP